MFILVARTHLHSRRTTAHGAIRSTPPRCMRAEPQRARVRSRLTAPTCSRLQVVQLANDSVQRHLPLASHDRERRYRPRCYAAHVLSRSERERARD